jgi:hypothetical protein
MNNQDVLLHRVLNAAEKIGTLWTFNLLQRATQYIAVDRAKLEYLL